MKRITFLVAVVATLAGVFAAIGPARGQTDKQATPVFLTAIPPRYRDWRLITVAHEAGNLNSLGAVLGNTANLWTSR